MIILKPFDVLIDAEQTNPQNVHDFFSIFYYVDSLRLASSTARVGSRAKKTRANLNSNQKNERFGKFHVCQSQVDGDGFYEWESSRGFEKRGQNVVILEAEQWRIWLNHRIIRKHMEMLEIRVDRVKLLHIQLDTRCVDSDEDVLTLIIGLWVITNFSRTGNIHSATIDLHQEKQHIFSMPHPISFHSAFFFCCRRMHELVYDEWTGSWWKTLNSLVPRLLSWCVFSGKQSFGLHEKAKIQKQVRNLSQAWKA